MRYFTRKAVALVVVGQSFTANAILDNVNFESNNPVFSPRSSAVELALSTEDPIAGAQSLSLNYAGWGTATHGMTYTWGQGPQLSGITFRAKARVVQRSGGSRLKMQVNVSYTDGRATVEPHYLDLYTNQLQEVCVSAPLDAERTIYQVGIQLVSEGAQAEIQLDDVSLEAGLPTQACDSVVEKQKVVITPPSNTPNFFLSAERIALLEEAVNTSSAGWSYMKAKLDGYLDKESIYNGYEYAAAYALSYRVSGNHIHGQKARALYKRDFLAEGEHGWPGYTSRNGFRSKAKWSQYAYDWAKEVFTAEEQAQIEASFVIWGEYWKAHVDYDNDFAGFRWADTDETTSLAENISLIGMSLLKSANPEYVAKGTEYVAIGDALLNRYVVAAFMDGMMAGGHWAEGIDYSPATMQHWIRQYIVNKESRGIDYPNDYGDKVVLDLVHNTIAGYKGLYNYADLEEATDYHALGDAYRYELILHLLQLAQDPQVLAMGRHWYDQMIAHEGHPTGSMVTGLWRFLFEQTDGMTEAVTNADTLFFAPGTGFVASRSDWTEQATNLYFSNSAISVDHQHYDALSFDIAHEGVWVTKELTGYAGASVSSEAHNTLLIENATDGSSNPTMRPVGSGTVSTLYDDDKITLITADAQDTYNMTGYFGANYAKDVTRQLALLKPGFMVVYDHVITDSDAVKDLVQYKPELGLVEGDQHVRWVKQVQHFQTQPEFNGEYYSAVSEGKIFMHKTLLPHGYQTEVIDESVLWADQMEYMAPVNQRRWHTLTKAPSPVVENEFLNLMAFGDEETTVMPQAVELNKANGAVIKGNVIGIAMTHSDEANVVLFSRDDSSALNEQISLLLPHDYANARIYISGLVAGASYKIQSTPNGDTFTPAQDGNYRVNEQGVLIYQK